MEKTKTFRNLELYVGLTEQEKHDLCNREWSPLAGRLRNVIGLGDAEIGAMRCETHRLATRPLLDGEEFKERRHSNSLSDTATEEELPRIINLWYRLRSGIDTGVLTSEVELKEFMVEEIKKAHKAERAEKFRSVNFPDWTVMVHMDKKYDEKHLPSQLGVVVPMDLFRSCGVKDGIPSENANMNTVNLVLTGGRARGAYSVTPTPVSNVIHAEFGIDKGYTKTGYRYWSTCRELFGAAEEKLKKIVKDIIANGEIYFVKSRSKSADHAGDVFRSNTQVLQEYLVETYETILKYKIVTPDDLRQKAEVVPQMVSTKASATLVAQPITTKSFVDFAFGCAELDMSENDVRSAKKFFDETNPFLSLEQMLDWVKRAKHDGKMGLLDNLAVFVRVCGVIETEN